MAIIDFALENPETRDAVARHLQSIGLRDAVQVQGDEVSVPARSESTEI